MKKNIFTILLLTIINISAFPQLSEDGYYRLQNDNTGRFVRMIDNRGSISVATTTADLAALETVRPISKVISDPSSVMYISNLESNIYNIACQGTSLVEMMGFGIKISEVNDKPGCYRAYQEQNGIRQYLNDEVSSDDYGVVLSNDKNSRDWKTIQIDVNSSSSYFGIAPELNSNGKYYSSFYAGFSFSLYSSGMKAYYVNKVDADLGVCVVEEISGIISSSTPLIIECSQILPENNRLDLNYVSTSAPNDNLLKGVYFDNSSVPHYNRVAYDPSTMRMLGVTKSGKIGFIKSSIDFIPANRMYLSVPVGTPDELVMVTNEEYKTLGVEDVIIDEVISDSYSIDGIKLQNNNESTKWGIYLRNGKKYIGK